MIIIEILCSSGVDITAAVNNVTVVILGAYIQTIFVFVVIGPISV
jgi:hypothetical protein